MLERKIEILKILLIFWQPDGWIWKTKEMVDALFGWKKGETYGNKRNGGSAFWMKKGATNGNQKKWWIRFLDEKVPTMETKEIVDSMLNGKKRMRNITLDGCHLLHFVPVRTLPPSAVVGGVLETGPSLSGYRSGFHIWYPWLSKGTITRFWSIYILRLSINEIPYS